MTPTSDSRGASTSPTMRRVPSRASKCQRGQAEAAPVARTTASGPVEAKSSPEKRPTTGVLGPISRPKRGTYTETPSRNVSSARRAVQAGEVVAVRPGPAVRRAWSPTGAPGRRGRRRARVAAAERHGARDRDRSACGRTRTVLAIFGAAQERVDVLVGPQARAPSVRSHADVARSRRASPRSVRSASPIGSANGSPRPSARDAGKRRLAPRRGAVRLHRHEPQRALGRRRRPARPSCSGSTSRSRSPGR